MWVNNGLTCHVAANVDVSFTFKSTALSIRASAPLVESLGNAIRIAHEATRLQCWLALIGSTLDACAILALVAS